MIYYQRDDEDGGTALGVVSAILAVGLTCILPFALGLSIIAVSFFLEAFPESLYAADMGFPLLALLYFVAYGATWYGAHRFLLSPWTVQVTERGVRIGRDNLPWPRRREELIIVEKHRLGGRIRHRAIYDSKFGRVRLRALEAYTYGNSNAARQAVEARLDQVWAACEQAREDAAERRRQAAAEPGADAQK
ncbi:hypothetical protein CWT12_03090 [Actinomyces sp. 432]|uniref:hypothetical protein n=1 Tax=unclassified Actinomyces TaxID=2609248 RepID=UPI001373FEBD|nr:MULTISPECIES: hypothetical protein [unclassified Actinomyces]MBW3069553.1 hypothetical protein [Actinomyces sp. 594]QHO90525.1 hypothetical protein CWT12_03090 [Actinomyces sp. 432]